MPVYCTEYWVVNVVGRAHKMCSEVEAESEIEARALAETLGHTFLGLLIEEIEAPEMADYCDRVQRQRDKDWQEGLQ